MNIHPNTIEEIAKEIHYKYKIHNNKNYQAPVMSSTRDVLIDMCSQQNSMLYHYIMIRKPLASFNYATAYVIYTMQVKKKKDWKQIIKEETKWLTAMNNLEEEMIK